MVLNEVYILIGGNLGNREKVFSEAKELIKQEIGEIIKTSSIYETQPWGFNSDQSFLNQVIVVETLKSAIKTLKLLLDIEKRMGRIRTLDNYESRPLDLDILFYNNSIIDNQQLQVPHPRLHRRMFTLIPLNEIASIKVHPQLKETINTLVDKCTDPLLVKIFKPAN